MTVEVFAQSVRAAIARCEENVAALTSHEARSFRETVRDFDRLFLPLNGLGGRVNLYTNVHPDAAMRATCEELEQELARLATSVGLNRGLYERLASVRPGADATAEERRLHAHALRDFRRSGVDADEATRDRIRALREELVAIGQEFDRNIIRGGREVVVQDGHAGLAGLPADFLRAHPERPDGSVLLTTDPTDRMPVLTYARDEELRRRYHHAYDRRAWPENSAVLARLLARRHELARLLGYRHWADYSTEDKMTTSAGEARTFLERVVELARGRALAEHEELREEKRRAGSESDVREYDRFFLVELARKRRYAFDSQDVRPYFAYERVRDGVLATSARLYGVTFERNTTQAVWHDLVECYDVVDAGEVVARFYLDMHPRPDKYKHGAMFEVSCGASQGVLPEAALVCNFPEPTADDSALLLHEDVTTFFHEFGHLLHHLFAGRQRFLSFAGISTEFDFVEVPSQVYEEWAWSPDVLATFARHVDTDEPIPPDLVRRMRAAEGYGRASSVLGQMYFALLSLTYHDRDPATLDPDETMIALKEMLPTPHEPDTHMQVAFGHLHGYSALYYTYMWSLVIARDVLSRFESDLMSGATANEYRREVLSPGGSKDANELVRGFLGRDYAFDAFERWLAG